MVAIKGWCRRSGQRADDIHVPIYRCLVCKNQSQTVRTTHCTVLAVEKGFDRVQGNVK